MRALCTDSNDNPSGASRPFNSDRAGFILGEGAWMFVMERESTARARGAHIYAEVAGYGSTCDAYHRVRMDDSGEEPARAMSLAMKDGWTSGSGMGMGLYGVAALMDDVSSLLQSDLGERTSQAVEQKLMEVSSSAAGLEHLERPEYADKVKLVKDRSFIPYFAFTNLNGMASIVFGLTAAVVLLAFVHPVLILLPPSEGKTAPAAGPPRGGRGGVRARCRAGRPRRQ